MTFAGAKKKLKKIAGDEYHSLSYELTEHHDGEQGTSCVVYIHGRTHHKGLTWQDAFKSLDLEINGQTVDSNEQPKGES